MNVGKNHSTASSEDSGTYPAWRSDGNPAGYGDLSSTSCTYSLTANRSCARMPTSSLSTWALCASASRLASAAALFRSAWAAATSRCLAASRF
jgi:hypothetical protein